MNDNKRKLYDALSNDYDMGTYEQFRKDLEDKDKRRKLYDATSDAYDFGDYDQFEAQLGYGQSQSAPSAEEINSGSAGPVMPKPAMENRNWEVQMGNGHNRATVEKPEPVDVPIPQRPEGQEPSDDGTAAPSGDVRSYLENANRQQVANLSRDINSRLDEAQTKSRDIYMKEQEDARKGGFLSTLAHAIAASGHNPEGRSGGMSDAQQRTLQGANIELQSEISKLEAAKKAMSNAEEIIAEADKSVQEGKFPRFVKGVARGFGDKLFDVNTWDMGVSDTKNSIELLKALRKYDEGEPLSESEQMLLDAKSVELATNAYFGSYIGRGYKAGAVTAQSLPFMLEMAVNPASTLGESTQSMLARYALSRFAKKGATRAAQKFATKAAGAAGRALGDIAGSAVMAGTSGAVRVAGDAIDRHVGDIETDMDGQGQTVFAGHDPESLGESIAKAFTSTAIENHSEMLGEYFAPALGIVSKLGRKGMEKFGLKKVVDFVDDVSATDAAKLIADFQKRTKWNGTIGEYAEEVAGNIENAILVGDNTLDASDDTGVFNLDQNIDTFLGVALMGGVFSAVRTAMWRTPKYRARMEMEKARDEARTKYGSEAWQEIEDRMAEAGDDGMSAVLSTVIAGENSPEKAKALLDYAKSIKKYEGMLAGDEKRREIASPEATDLETSYENGYTLSTPQEVHDAKLMFEYQEAMLQKALGTSDIDIDTIMLGNEMGPLTDEQKSVAMDYLNAKATFDGVIDRVRDDLDSRISSVENAIDASTNRDTGMLQPASLVDDRPVHIISGIVRLTPDGTMVDTRNSENFIIVRDDRTGRMETISPSDINRLENEIDPAMEKQAARQQIQDVYGSREADSIDGVLAFNPGDTYTLTNGQGQSFPVQIVENEQGSTDNGDGTVNVILNNDIDPQTGQPRITQMPKEQIQEMAEATNLSRLQQYEQQKLARAAEQAETDATGRTPENPFRINDRITLSDAETGNVENGVVGSELTDDGKYEVVVEKQDGSQSILYLSPSELEQLGAKLEQPEAVEERNAPVLEQNQPVLEQKTEKAEQESAMSRIPSDRDGEPQFEQAQPSDTWEALLELNGGNAVEAEDTARQMYENASKNLDKAQKTKPKSGTSVMEIQRNKAERNGQIDELRKSVDFWGKVLSFPEVERKSASAAAAAGVRQKEDAKREAVRQAKENLAKGRKLMQQKGTYYKDDAKLGDYLDFHDYALRMIANGRVKFVWKNDADNNSIKGLGGHLGLEDSESERKALFSLLANQDKGGLRPDDAAEQLSEEYNSSLGAEVISSSEALDVILDIIRTYGGKTRDMMNAAIDAHAMAGMDERGHDEDNKSSEDKDNSKIAEGQESLPADAPLSNEMNEFGVPFIESSDGTTVFGVLTDDSGLSPAPIKLSLGENATDKNGTNHGYGLLHIEAGHGDQIRAAGYDSIEKFVEDVARNYDTIREGGIVANNQTYLLELSDEHNNTLFIQLSRDGSYWNINSAGIFKKKYSRRKPEVFTRPALKTETDTDSGRVDSSRFNGATAPAGNSHQTSEGKDTNISEESNTGSEKSVAEQITEQREVVNTEPTEAQKEAGNYRMGHVKIDGMDVTIENPKGSIRRGTDADGKEWQSEMHHDYGYIRGTKAVDNDHIDIFLSDNPETGNVFVVDQVNPKTGEFDESKVMYGFASEQEARDAYLSNYEKGWKGLGKITEVTREEFKKWIESSTRKTKPFSEYASVKTAEAQKEKGTSTEVSDSSKNNTSDKASERGFILMDDFIESALQEAYENRTDKSLSRDDWNEEDEAIDAENKANDDYYQYIESLSNSGELQKMYDASSIGEQIKMRKSIGEAGHEFKDLIDTTKAADARKEAREKKKKEEYRLKMKTLGIDIEDDDVQPSTKKPEAQKEKPVQGLEGYSREEIKGIVTDHINDVMRDYDIDAEIIGMDIHGSRNRHDARPDSDLDVVVEYSGDIREDDMFNALNGEENALSIEGIKVDINPIRKEETRDLQNYMKQSEEYDKEKSEHASIKPLDGNAQKNIIVDAFREWNGKLRKKYRSSPQFSELDNAISIAKYQADEGNVKPDAQKNFEKAVRLIPELYFGSGDIQFSIGKKNYETTSSGVKDFAEKYGVSQEAVEDYANGMRLGTGAGCGLALLNIRRVFRLANSTLKFAEFSHEYAKLKQELFDKFGDYEKLKAQQIAEADARRDTMEAARKRIEEEQQRKKAEYEARIARYKGMSLEELDSEYFKALENNDEVSARDIVDEVARRNGYADVTSDYQGAGAWAAPSRPGGYTDEERRASLETDSPDLSLEDISLGYTVQPDDIFDHPERYMQSDSTSKEAARAIKATLNALKKGNKDAKIKMFRAVPLSVKEGRLRNGDWVTPSRAYADMHGNHRLEGEYRVIEEEVPAKDLWWDGNDVREWGYDDGTARRYANVENNTKLNDVITRDDAGNIIPPSRRFDLGNADERYQISGRKAIDEGSEESRIAYEAVKEQFDRIGIPVELLSDQAMREMAINATMLDTALPEDESSFKGTVISSIDGAKVLRNLDNAIDDYQNVGDKGTKTFLGDLASALGSSDKDKSSQYATFETKNGQVVTIRVSNHNATISNFDNAGESNGISIVISRKPNEGMTNDGDAHIVEFFYPDKALNKAEGKPLVEILKSIKQSLYSGEYKDTTGLAQREEVNAKESVEFLREPDGTVYGATVGGKIYLNRERLNPNTPIHEYTHLWFSALEKANPELYKRGVELMKQLPIWEEVKTDPNYANLSGDDAIASECLSRLVGDKGAEKLTELAKKAMVRGDIIGTANRISLIEEFKDWLKKFWTWVRGSFAPWTKEEASRVSVDDIQNMVLSDLVKGVNPLARQAESDPYIRFSIVKDPKLIEELDKGPKVRVYRAMQLIDGKLYPPMASKINGEFVRPIELGKWEQADEHPELIDKNGRFNLNKGNGKGLKAAYNPYIHTSRTPLNDQFSEAQSRPNIVTVEVEIPKSELSSGYKADKAKDSVGEMEWKAGIVQGQLTGKRKVILSRWDKPIRIVPDSEVANVIVNDMFKGRTITMPSNVVTPSLRAELEKLGVPFVQTDNTGHIVGGQYDGKHYSKVYGNRALAGNAKGKRIESEIDRIVREAKENGTYMKAPNGKPTNLDERQWAQVRTGAFKKWFGDWEKAAEESPSAAKTNSSKIVDENGEPKVVYHGSPYRFFRFDKARLGQSTGADSAKEGFFFTDNKDLAELFSRYSLEKLPVSDVEQLVKDRLQNMSREELNEAYEAYRNDSPDYQDYADEAGSPSDREYLEMSGFLRDGISEDEAKRNYVQDSIENKIEGGYFSDMEEIEEELSSIGIEFGNNEQVFLNIKSPITDDIERDYFHNGEDVSPMTPVLQEAKRMWHDGVVFTGIVENGQKGAANQYVAFEPGQIKSATDNVGTFDGEQDDIRYRDSGQTDAEYMSAIESGDMRKAGRMVEAAFRKAFPGSKVKNIVYHGVAVSEDGRQFPYNSIREGHFTDDEGFAEYYAGSDGYVYKVFLDIESPLEQDFRGQNSDFARDAEGNDVSTRTFARRAKESNGRYDGAIISNVDEYGDGIEADGAGNYDGSVTDYIPVSADQIYSAEPVVYDDNGQVVPLSKRFVAGNPDIRYKQDGAVNGSRTSQDVETAAARLAESLGEKVRIVRDVNEIENLNKKVQENQRRSKGWFNTGTGEIVVVLPNATGIEDVQATILHEAVGHKGLRELVGEDRFYDFLDKVYAAATKATRLEIVSLARRNHWDFRLATEEYIAGLAEKGFSGRENRTLFGKIKDFFLDMLSRAKIALGFNIGDNELRYMLWRTYQMRTSRGILAKANDMAVQQELKVGNFREDQLRGRNGFTENDIAEMETPILESRGTFAKLADAEKWAKENLQGKTFVNSFTGDEINISGHSIKEMLAPKFSKAINEKTHMAAIMSVPDFIETGIPAEIHKDTHGRGYDVMRLYNAIVIDGEPYRVKSTVKRYVDGDRYYTYEIQEMELLKGTQTTALGLDDSSRPQLQSSITGANLLKGVKKTNSDEEILSGDDSRLRFRTSGNGGSSNTARDIYEEKTRVIDRNGRKSDTANLMRRLKEAYVDSMQSLKYLQDAISEETGKPVEDFENAYLAENSMSSKNKAQTDIYLNRFFNPIKDAIRDLQKEGAEYGDIVRYLMAKHGLERNEVFSKRDAEKDGGVWDGSVRRDYSGLTELTRRDTDTVAPRIDEITSRAEDIVRKFEMDHDTDVLWEKINAATKDTLRTSYVTGMLTKDNYEMVRSMFRYYIPLRGWSENTASAVYDYLSDARPKTSSIVKAATGRTTISDDPIATIAYMGQSAIIQGNRNLMKQKLLNLALNHKTGLLTVSRQWEVLDPVTGMWTPRDPDIPADAAPEQVADIVADFEKDMKEAEKKGVARLSRGKLDTGKHLTAYEGQEHIIKVKRGGIDYSIYLNGNPRAAQAVNGMTNPDAVDSWLIRKARVIKNFMARMFTSQNPAFIISNLSRDVIFAGTAVYAKEDAKYAARYAKNITVALAKGQLIGLIHRFETDRLDNSKDLDRYFGEFIRNGGETGFTQLNTVDDFKRDIDRFAREMKQGQVMKVPTKVWNGIWDGVELMNRCAEDVTRFSAYMTSRQMGRSVERSISDAKEITVNFNRKGSGGYGARLMNFAYIFFNAAVQSLANAGKMSYEHPAKVTAILGAFSASGFLAPLLTQTIISLCGGDDDAYWDLPEWVRRNNFVFYIPWSDNKFLIIPISQELRPFYAMGEIAMSVLMGKEEVLDGLKSAAGSFMDLLPIDFMGNGGNLAISLTPTVAQPFAQLVANTDYFGSPIYRRNDYNKLDPAWTKAYKGTSPMLVNASKWLNEVTGGDDVKRGWIDPINNPAVIEHLFESYLGGTGKTINRAAKTFSMIWNPDMRDIRNVPIASTFIQESDDERVAGNQLNREYFKLMDEFKETSHTVSGYKKKARMGSMEYADKLNEFMETPDFERYSKARGYANTISKLRQALKRAQESGEDVMVEENLQQILHDLKRQMVEELKEQ